ncbi:hypothetical protein FBUS_05383 [Fasciolopsis buskii]|uniref:Protein phosphatase 1 regulatory subunit 32 n=1 Tax=Fasciolopsis buskii TaxID=27845 RepID=A0A8E0RTE1_9TREM|nr:hypothetical protein FBUS_05383 [Fasciolopsis buski]
MSFQSNFSSVKEKMDRAVVSPKGKRRPQLLKNSYRGEAEEENSGYGPAFGSTTYNASFGPPLPKAYELLRTNLGKKEETGNTRNTKPENTITGRPDNPHLPGEPGWKTDRLTGTTEYNEKYKPFCVPDGTESFPRWTKPPRFSYTGSFAKEGRVLPDYVPVHSENTYGRPENFSEERMEELRKKNPTEYQNRIYQFKEPTVSKGFYQGLQREPPSLAERVGRRKTGPPTRSGFTFNQKGHVDEPDTPCDRFVTHYMTRFYHPPPGSDVHDREGHVHFNTQPSKLSALSNEVECKHIEPQMPATDILPTLPPYQAR